MAFIDTLSDRQLDALIAIEALLDDGQWHPHSEMLATALDASDLAPKTAGELIRRAWRAGQYRRATTTRYARAQHALYHRRDVR